jgi:hypothetical protein
VNPTDNLDLARIVAGRVKKIPEEAGFRCACGRAYYAAFAHARDALLAAKFAMAYTGKDHARVPSLLSQSTIPDLQAAASLLEQLHVIRKSADYDVGSKPVPLGERFNDIRAQTAVLLASSVIDEINRAVASDKRLAIPPGVI